MQDRVGSCQHGGRSTGARPVLDSLWRGGALKCPACGKGAMFRRSLKVVDACPHCGEELHHHRADDAPPYFTIVIVGHVVVGLVLAVEMAYRPPLWLHAALWLPLTVILALLILPVRGACRAAMGSAYARLRSRCKGRSLATAYPRSARGFLAVLTSGLERVGSRNFASSFRGPHG